MRRLVLALALAVTPLPAVAQEVLAEYWTDSGSLPPEYAWETSVSIATDGKVTVKHCKGYETEGPGCKIRKGKATAEQLQAIRDAATASGLIDKPARPREEIMVGGGSVSGAVHMEGKVIKLISWPRTEDQARITAVLSAITAAVPARLHRFIEGN